MFVLGTILVVTILANVIMGLMLSQSRFTHHQVSRIQAYYACVAAMNYVLEQLRLGVGGWTPNPPSGALKYFCLNGCVDPVVPTFPILNDADIPYNVQVTIYPQESGTNRTTRLDIKTDYTYTSP